MPPTGTYSSLFFWYRLVALTGAYTGVLVPGNALTRYQTHTFDRRWPKVPVVFAAGIDVPGPLARF